MSTTTTASKSPVEYIREDVMAKLGIWERIRAACEGEEAVKALSTQILPMPNPTDKSPANVSRYEAYLCRAVWYNVTKRTLDGLVGYVFKKEPKIEVPAQLQALTENIDGSGVTLAQQAKEALGLILSLGRCGLLVDYPKVTGATTQQQLNDGQVAPTIVLYDPERIVNWRTRVRGSRVVLELLVLKEDKVMRAKDDEFSQSTVTQYRVLDLKDDKVRGRIFRQDGDKEDFVEVKDEEYAPTNQGGTPLTEIPFVFLGAVNNDDAVDGPPLLDLANLNFAHFRNSADYEEACYITGQPTPWAAGLTEAWVKEVLKGEIHLGSRAVLPLPQGATCGLLQAAPNSMPHEAMEAKERQMVALGAKLVEQKEVQRTATEAGLEHSSEVSTLTSAATNVFLGYKKALGFAGVFVGADTAKLEFDLTEPLTRDVVTPEQANAITAMWQGGLIDFEEARAVLKKAGIAWKEDEVVKELVASEGLPVPTKPPAGNQPPQQPPAAE